MRLYHLLSSCTPCACRPSSQNKDKPPPQCENAGDTASPSPNNSVKKSADVENQLDPKRKTIPKVAVAIDEVVKIAVNPVVLAHYPSLHLPSYCHVRWYKSHLAALDYRMRVPAWVAERLAVGSIEGSADRAEARFVSDPTVPSFIRADNKDYIKSGYQRGHLAAAAAHKKDSEEMQSTFILSSNIVPQTRECNVSIWASLERFSRRLVAYYGSVYVVSGPLWMTERDYAKKELAARITDKKNRVLTDNLPESRVSSDELSNKRLLSRLHRRISQWMKSLIKRKQSSVNDISDMCKYYTIGDHCVAVPTHLFKIIVAVDPATNTASSKTQTPLPFVIVAAFVVPNTTYLSAHLDPVSAVLSCVRSIEYIEFRSGLDFSGIVEYATEQYAAMLMKGSAQRKGGSQSRNRTYASVAGGDQVPELFTSLDV